jgi:hypothetical protein
MAPATLATLDSHVTFKRAVDRSFIVTTPHG